MNAQQAGAAHRAISRVVETAIGRGLFATQDLPAGAIVEVFDGPVVSYARVPEHEARHVLWIGPDEWMIPTTPARFINHSCDPNCEVDDLRVVTRRAVSAGDELTFDYAGTSAHDPDDPDSFWDPRWTFRCQCASERCRGMVDGYVVVGT